MGLEISDGIGWLTFARLDGPNLLTPAFFDELERVLAACESDERVRVLVLRGSDRAFLVGADIRGLAEADLAAARRISERTMRGQERLADFPKPTVAVLTGYALGGGFEIALCCDFRIAADTARLGLPEIKLGVIPGGGGTQRLPRLVGMARAMELVLLGDTITAQQAFEHGLVNVICPQASLSAEAAAFAGRLAAQPAPAVCAAKAAVRQALDVGLKEGLRLEQSLFTGLFGTAEQREGMAAFLQKRPPVFYGTEYPRGESGDD
jgi:enoyl-CoA hydratase/carnithine racemase